MAKYEPIQGTKSKAAAIRNLKSKPDKFNFFNRHCPMINEQCLVGSCASWEDAEVYLSNPGRMESKDSVYDIKLGYCKNPLITGVYKNGQTKS